MSVAQFTKSFTATFRTTPYQYVLDRRISKAKTPLTTTALSMTEIALTVGFSSPSHFATTFKGRVGTTPSSYRSTH
ncbi:helix-turn-helix transcriptional regulator [Mycobacteroides abscessus]|uniref:helix-turn-helix transcriptional regulator n=1 Tax=Mycobacteroides abscessus TaxID=36809 RepID=UPI001F3DE6CA|nr:helix-turn-helix transcriptional regulator [Mycobacteroides abscessus]